MSIPPTLSPDFAAGREWDAVVIGAGPAGAMAARELARRGATALLIDRARFPRYKVCGGCLNPRSLRYLRKAGLGALTESLGAIPLTALRLGARGRFADVRLPTGAGVSREALDAALIRAAIGSGVEFLPGATASVLPMKSFTSHRTVRLREAGKDHYVDAKVVLSASGLASKVDESTDEPSAPPWETGSRIGAGVMVPHPIGDYQPHVIYMACSSEGYVGQVLVEDGRMDVAAALDPMAVKAAGGTGELAERILDRAGFPVQPGLATLPWKGTPHLTRQAPSLGGERLFVLGDAAGYIEPFTGEGMAWALAGATEVTPLAMRVIRNEWRPSLLSRWTANYRRSVSRRQFVCRLTADLLRRRLTTQLMVRSLDLMPWIAKPFLGFMYRE